jgi:hypothetical protein
MERDLRRVLNAAPSCDIPPFFFFIPSFSFVIPSFLFCHSAFSFVIPQRSGGICVCECHDSSSLEAAAKMQPQVPPLRYGMTKGAE